MICGNCGTENQGGVEFCSECGSALAAAETTAVMPQAPAFRESTASTQAPSFSITPISVCAAGLAISFFLPWINGGFLGSYSGSNIAKFIGGNAQFLWLIPAMGAITCVAGLVKKGHNGLATLSGLGTLGFIVYVVAKAADEAGGSSSKSSSSNSGEIFSVIGIGIYLMIAMAVVLMILGIRGLAKSQK